MDIVLDTNILSDLLVQYFSTDFHRSSKFYASQFISEATAREINLRVKWHSEEVDHFGDNVGAAGLVIASTFAFVEIARQFDEISAGRYSLDQFRTFIEQPPNWFFAAAVDTTLARYLCQVPAYVRLAHGGYEPMEVADAIHVATALSRDRTLLAATDKRIRQVSSLADLLV